MSLCDRYRPRTLDEIAGNDKARGILRTLVARPFASAFLLKLDHVIIGASGYVSLAQRGLMGGGFGSVVAA